MQYISKFRLHKKFPYEKLSWSLFSHIRTEYGDLQNTSPHSLQMQEIRTRKTPYTDTFHAVLLPPKSLLLQFQGTNIELVLPNILKFKTVYRV